MKTTPECLPWVHRRVMQTALDRQHGRPDIFASIEDDIELTWEAVLSWASDTALLRESSGGLLARQLVLREQSSGDLRRGELVARRVAATRARRTQRRRTDAAARDVARVGASDAQSYGVRSLQSDTHASADGHRFDQRRRLR